MAVVGVSGAACVLASPPAAGTTPLLSRGAAHATHLSGWATTPLTVAVGDRFTETVRVWPKGRARLYRVKWRTDGGSWKVTQRGRASATGRVRVRHTITTPGEHQVKVQVPRRGKARAAHTSVRDITTPTPTPTPTPKPTSTPTPTPTPTPSPWRMTAYAVGDIGWCGGHAADTAALIPAGSTVLALGDLAYPNGTRQNFTDCYLPDYGSLLNTTFPVPGNHEYNNGALGYFDVFGSRVGTRQDPWYAFTRGDWSFYQLNSNCSAVGGCGPGSRQYEWVSARLAAETNECIAVSWHHPRWSASSHGPAANLADLYSLVASQGADVLLTGHEHDYQRFARLDAAGAAAADGVREFVVGTGGAPLYPLDASPPPPLPQVSDSNSFGVLKLDLTSSGYAWRFLAADGSAVDSGSDSCG